MRSLGLQSETLCAAFEKEKLISLEYILFYQYYFIFQIKHSGVVAACGLAGGMELKGSTVAPFILRGVTLRGIDSVFQNMETRHSIYIRTVSS